MLDIESDATAGLFLIALRNCRHARRLPDRGFEVSQVQQLSEADWQLCPPRGKGYFAPDYPSRPTHRVDIIQNAGRKVNIHIDHSWSSAAAGRNVRPGQRIIGASDTTRSTLPVWRTLTAASHPRAFAKRVVQQAVCLGKWCTGLACSGGSGIGARVRVDRRSPADLQDV